MTKFKDIVEMPTMHNVGMKGFNIPTTSKMYNADEIDNISITEASVGELQTYMPNIFIKALSKDFVIIKRRK